MISTTAMGSRKNTPPVKVLMMNLRKLFMVGFRYMDTAITSDEGRRVNAGACIDRRYRL
jgi:hypothetical protein